MIYVDTSVVLAHVFAEPIRPPLSLWERTDLMSSRLTEVESWVRTHAYGRAATEGAALAELLARVHLIALEEQVCARCRAPFPMPVRALDALHLSTADFLRTKSLDVEIATYDARMATAAVAMGFVVVQL